MGVVIVTGGTFGIGKSISLVLASKGHDVVAFGLDSPQPSSHAKDGTAILRAESQQRGYAMDVLEADVSSAADVARIVDFTLNKHGRIDGLVNNAAIGPLGTILDTSEELWDRIIDVNVKGTFLCCKAVIPHMIERGGGTIVNTGSGAGWGKPNMFAYSASKGAIFALSTALSYDFFHHHIRVNVVIPGGGGIATGMSLGRVGGDLTKFGKGASGTVAGRTAGGDDIAYAVAFLLSPEAEVISGAVIDVGSFAHQGGPIPNAPARA